MLDGWGDGSMDRIARHDWLWLSVSAARGSRPAAQFGDNQQEPSPHVLRQ